MTIHLELVPILSIAAGIAVLAVPRSARYIIGAYLIAFGVIQML
ncbi:MAG: DUF3096 domain-containing protein [Halofilum sp. (in: g-proteobacteria)]|nr:DUF3096 domain-containing protein [Halofilum sp. (in: g-proteobacteria)]